MPNSKHRKSLIHFEFPVITDSDENCSSISIDIRFDIIDLYAILRPNCRNRSVKFHIFLSPPSRTPYPAKIPIYRIQVLSSFVKQADFRTYGINIHDTATKFHIDSHHQLQQTDFFSRTTSTYWMLVSRVTAAPDHTQRERERERETHTPQSVGLLWARDQPVAKISTWQHTKFTIDTVPWPRRDSNPQFQHRAAADLGLSPRGHWDRTSRPIQSKT